MRFSPRQHGFSLIELIIAMSIFVLVATFATVAFAQIIRSQTFINSGRNLQEEGRFLLEKMIKEFHNGTIDYPQYFNDHWGGSYSIYQALPDDESSPPVISDGVLIAGSNRNLEIVLNIISPDGTLQTKVRRNPIDETVDIQKLSSCIDAGTGEVQWNPLPEYIDGGDDFLPLSPTDIQVTNLSFFIFPLKDPNKVFADDTVQFQPTVIIRATVADPQSDAVLDVQTTVTSRIYDEAEWAVTGIPDC